MRKNWLIIIVIITLTTISFSDSLWNKSSKTSIISNNKDYSVGDFITVIVRESPSLSMDDDIPGYKSTTIDTLGSVVKNIGGTDLTKFLPLGSTDPSSLKVSNNKVKSSTKANVSLYITAKITKIDKNIYTIRGEKEIKIDNQRKKMIIEGDFAKDSINDGYIESSKIANAKIWYAGDIIFQQDPNEPSWISWILSGIANVFY